MRKYLVRLANETANHLIKDTLEPAADASTATAPHIDWQPMSTIRGIEIFRGVDTSDQAADIKDTTCLRGITEVNASIEEFAMLFKMDSNRELAEHGLLFNPDLLDMATLYSLVQPSGEHPRRYVGIKWCLMQSPARIFRNRDFCYLECQKEFEDAHGRRGWVRSMHSIKMPCCPSLEKSHGIVRASLYRCGLIAVETDRPGVLSTTYTIEMDLKGHFPEIFQPKFLSQRIAALASIDRFLQQQRLSSSPLLGDLDIPSTKTKSTCHFCFRAFSTFTRRFVCRKCGEGVCRHCSDEWSLDIPVIGRKKVRICTVCSAEARYCLVGQRLSTRSRPSQPASTPKVTIQDRQPRQSQQYRPSDGRPSAQERLRRASRQHTPQPTHGNRDYRVSPPHQSDDWLSRRSTPYLYENELTPPQPYDYHRQSNDPGAYSFDEFPEFDNIQVLTGIRGTADITKIWTAQDAADVMAEQRESESAQPVDPRRRGVTWGPYAYDDPPHHIDSRASIQDGRQRARAPTVHGDRLSNHRDTQLPPSTRYSLMENRMQRSNSFDTAQHEEFLYRRGLGHISKRIRSSDLFKPDDLKIDEPFSTKPTVSHRRDSHGNCEVPLEFPPRRYSSLSDGAHVEIPSPTSGSPPTFTFVTTPTQRSSNQREPPASPELAPGEVVEYVEGANGEWIANRHSVTLPETSPRMPRLHLDELETESVQMHACDKCGAAQYLYEGVVEATCSCNLADSGYSATKPVRQSSGEECYGTKAKGHTAKSALKDADPLPYNREADIALMIETLSRQSLHSCSPAAGAPTVSPTITSTR
ncbi:hypothetical protein PINS_up004574 [Pythium insidiosum]|nr:hypothetical protein PINS_up004574 [Pythium insidiosum]